MRCCIAKSVTRVGKTAWRECRHSIGYLLTWATLYKSFAILTGAYPANVILVSHLSVVYSALLIR